LAAAILPDAMARTASRMCTPSSGDSVTAARGTSAAARRHRYPASPAASPVARAATARSIGAGDGAGGGAAVEGAALPGAGGEAVAGVPAAALGAASGVLAGTGGATAASPLRRGFGRGRGGAAVASAAVDPAAGLRVLCAVAGAIARLAMAHTHAAVIQDEWVNVGPHCRQ